MPNKTFKTRYKLEKKDDSSNIMGIAITLDLNHSCSEIDRCIENMVSALNNTLHNYQAISDKPKKKKKGISNVV